MTSAVVDRVMAPSNRAGELPEGGKNHLSGLLIGRLKIFLPRLLFSSFSWRGTGTLIHYPL